VSINAFEISLLVTGLVTADAAWRRITVSEVVNQGRKVIVKNPVLLTPRF